MELRKGPLPSPVFWSTYAGIVITGVGGALIGTGAATTMILFRRAIEPWMPLILGIIARRTHGYLRYSPHEYPWIVGGVYALSVLWLGAAAYSAYRKPALDRRIDQHLLSRQMLDSGQFSTTETPFARKQKS